MDTRWCRGGLLDSFICSPLSSSPLTVHEIETTSQFANRAKVKGHMCRFIIISVVASQLFTND